MRRKPSPAAPAAPAGRQPERRRARLEAAVIRPAELVVADLRSFLSRTGRANVAARLGVNMPAFPAHVTVFDVDAATAAGPNADASLAIRAVFGPTEARGPEVAAQAWGDAHRFIAAGDQAVALEEALSLLEHLRDAAGTVIETGRASLALGAPPSPLAALPAPAGGANTGEEAPHAA